MKYINKDSEGAWSLEIRKLLVSILSADEIKIKGMGLFFF